MTVQDKGCFILLKSIFLRREIAAIWSEDGWEDGDMIFWLSTNYYTYEEVGINIHSKCKIPMDMKFMNFIKYH